jgi:hypothetical protein
MYTHDLACISLGDKITEPFYINQGVKQGCILSPLLFNIFISDLSSTLGDANCTPTNIDETKTINSIIWADDLLMLSETEDGLNNMLNNLNEYTKANLIYVNLEKTKCMIFNKSGRLIRRNFWLGNKKVEMVREYKYLGFLITPSINLYTALTDLKDRSLRALGAIKSKLGVLFRKHIPTTIHLFDSLVKPILLYASDFWACLKLPRNNPIENLHIKFCKDLLGVQIQTVNVGVLLELGRLPLCTYGKKNVTKNWERIGLQKKANTMVLSSYLNSQEYGWANCMKNCFAQAGLLELFLNIRTGTTPNMEMFRRERDIFQQTALSDIQNMSKLRTYKDLKNDAKFEKYLTSVQNVSDRIALTKLRLSNHTLMIEKGRHQNIKLFDRTCPFCTGEVENELHFLVKCPTYFHIRQQLLDKIKEITMGFYYPDDEQFLLWFLLNNWTISHLTARYISLAMELRTFLLDKPRNKN